MSEPRIGVFICHCGSNIAGFLDLPQLVEYARTLPHVAFVQDNLYTCSDAGRAQIRDAIVTQGLNRVVVASCTPRTHEPLFRDTCSQAGLNPYLFEFVNIRDQCSWVHMHEPVAATAKAKDLLRMGVARAALLEPESPVRLPVMPAAMVIGGGIAGLTVALDLAERGFPVKLVEREPNLGGLLNRLHRLYPTGEDAPSFIARKVAAVAQHPGIEVFTSTQVSEIRGFVGNYDVTLRRGDEQVSLSVGAIVVATGAQEFRPAGLFGYDGQHVITQGELQQALAKGESPFAARQAATAAPGKQASATAAIADTKAAVRSARPPSIVMIQCVGARDDTRPYCSRICCGTALKNALLIKETDPSAAVYILYRDLLALGIAEEDLYAEARSRGVTFIQYDQQRPPLPGDGQVTVYDALLGEPVRLPCDLLVLSTPLVSQSGTPELAQMLKVPVDAQGFFLEAHVKLRPLDFATDGIFLCGCARWPCGVGEAIAQAHGAAARASILLGRAEIEADPTVAVVDEQACIGCGLCQTVCPYSAIVLSDSAAGGRKARTIAASCKGCGICSAGCPEGAITMQHFTDAQVFAQIDALAGVASGADERLPVAGEVGVLS